MNDLMITIMTDLMVQAGMVASIFLVGVGVGIATVLLYASEKLKRKYKGKKEEK